MMSRRGKARGRIEHPTAAQRAYWARGEEPKRHTLAQLERAERGEPEPLPNACPLCGEVLGESEGACARCAEERRQRNQRDWRLEQTYQKAIKTGPLW